MWHPGFGIAIENKIYAVEQEEQLARYASLLEKRHGKRNGLVLYLTLNGKKSETHAGAIPYVRISYANHILTWLEKCLRETHAIIPINQVLLQYRAVVLKLTGQNLNKYMDDITSFITSHPDIIRFRNHINKGIDEVRARFLDGLAGGIKKELEDNSGLSVNFLPNQNGQRFGENSNARLIITPPDNSVLNKAPFKIYVEIDDEINALVVGIVTEKWHDWCCEPNTPCPSKEASMGAISDADKSLFELMRDRLLESGKISPQNQAENFHTWPLGWENLIDGIYDDEGLASLLKASLTENIAKVCDGIRKHIELLEQVYNEAKAMQLNAIQPLTTTASNLP